MNNTFKLDVNDKTYLRLPHPVDAERLFDLINKNREYLREFLKWVDRNTEVQHSKDFIEASLEKYREEAGLETLIVFEDRIIGAVGFSNISKEDRRAEMGYWLSAQHQGRGIMINCARKLLNYGFNFLGLNKVQVRVDEKNEKSKKLAVKLGFKREGVFKKHEWLHDHYQDMEYYSLFVEDWEG